MRILERKQLPEEVKELRPHPIDEEHNNPREGGCWVCHSGNGWEEIEEFKFDTELDAFYHPECLKEVGADSLIHFEMEVKQYNEEPEKPEGKREW